MKLSNLARAFHPVLWTVAAALCVAGAALTARADLPPAPALVGSLDSLKVRALDDGAFQVKAKVSLQNTTDTAIRHVTATAYLSDDNVLSDDDLKLVTVNLSKYFAKGKIGKGRTLSLPLKRKVAAVLAPFFEGKYLIVVLDADNFADVGGADPVVIGPLQLP